MALPVVILPLARGPVTLEKIDVDHDGSEPSKFVADVLRRVSFTPAWPFHDMEVLVECYEPLSNACLVRLRFWARDSRSAERHVPLHLRGTVHCSDEVRALASFRTLLKQALNHEFDESVLFEGRFLHEPHSDEGEGVAR